MYHSLRILYKHLVKSVNVLSIIIVAVHSVLHNVMEHGREVFAEINRPQIFCFLFNDKLGVKLSP